MPHAYWSPLNKQSLAPGHGNMEDVLTAMTSLIHNGKHIAFRSRACSGTSRSTAPTALWLIFNMEANSWAERNSSQSPVSTHSSLSETVYLHYLKT